ncbi:redox-sensitive bicupin YhaK (pirin superfamily) [Sphingomonas leidyi]|uniref:Redox-sensitive bicupin YhaK (Pirin superfamily) n=1 Tax=Sphingomonas leidyi TaxID=68569 RepID=A0A7X5ZW22_9SPHN|nr:pirin family protein [Sphingomonas leidyi]NIJ64993.1 redox-sensitive bicupin YhaK (pirin superfamily) [Sphingomonas leidyi]
MSSQTALAISAAIPSPREVVHRTRGRGGGPITRLMSPSDLGQYLKPFVFLDLVDAPSSIASAGNLHPHSGIATVTVLTEGNLRFDKGDWGTGLLDYGGVEWMRAGSAIWHGDEYRPDSAARFKGFQLWVALPEAMEMREPEWQFVEASGIPAMGPARLIAGAYLGERSPIRSFDGLNYLLVTLAPGEAWTYETPEGHEVGWLSLSHGSLVGADTYHAGEMIAFDRSDAPIALRAGPGGATFVLGSAVPHPHELVLGYYSVHTSAANLQAGEARIAEVRHRYA